MEDEAAPFRVEKNRTIPLNTKIERSIHDGLWVLILLFCYHHRFSSFLMSCLISFTKRIDLMVESESSELCYATC